MWQAFSKTYHRSRLRWMRAIATIAVLLALPAGYVLAGAPAVTVTVEQGAGQADPARLVPILFVVNFSEPVSGFTPGDVTLAGSAEPAQVSITGSGSAYTLAVSGMSGAGTVIVSLPAGVVQNGGGQQNEPSTSNDNIVSFDGTPPVLLSFQRLDPATESTDADVLKFRATFNESIDSPVVADFDVDGPTTALVSAVVQVSATEYDLTVSGGTLADLNGLVGIDLRPSQTIQDTAGNRLPNTEPLVDERYTVVNSGPEADLSISNTNGRMSVPFNGMLDYVITVGNAGPDEVSGAIVEAVVELPLIGASWICDPSMGASCSASGAGSISDLVNLPVDGELTYTLTATVAAMTEMAIRNTATVELPMGITDPSPGNNSATDVTLVEETIFSDSFEDVTGLKARQGPVNNPRPLSPTDIAEGTLVHERFQNGWELRASYWSWRGYWVPGPWVRQTSP